MLDWAEPSKPEGARLLAWHRDLVALRRAVPDLADDRLDRVEATHDEAARWLVVHRGGHRVVVNVADAEQAVPVEGAGGGSEVVLAWDGARVVDGAVHLPAHSTAVVRL